MRLEILKACTSTWILAPGNDILSPHNSPNLGIFLASCGAGYTAIQVTLDLYSHVLPDMQRAVAVQLDEALIAIQKDAGLL